MKTKINYTIKTGNKKFCNLLNNYGYHPVEATINISTHMTAEVEMAIATTSAVMIYGVPYSPHHLNSIENYFLLKNT